MNGANNTPFRVRRASRSERAEGVFLVLILLAVGVAAGMGSFTHVHDWTMDNSPAGTGDWFGWTNAVISELVPVASLLVMRRRRKAGQPVAYPMFLLVVALGLSISAQLAVAKPGLTGSVVSVIPALAFAALAKLVFGKTAVPQHEMPMVTAMATQQSATPVNAVVPTVTVPAAAAPAPGSALPVLDTRSIGRLTR
jgi:hypothetical protein